MQIKKGDKGNAVVDVQQRLAALGYELGPTGVDGFFGKWTDKAAKSFQHDRELTVSGVIDERTWRRIVDATYKLGDRALDLRSPFVHGADVTQLQRWLNGIGFRTEYVDGIFGPATEEAVREFQENLDLSVDGIVGPSTLAALNNIRGVLNKNQSSLLFRDLPSDSLVSLLQGRIIAVGSATPHKRQWLAAAGNNQLLCADLSHRLNNLLEVLGAETHFFKLHPEPQINGEIAVIFRSGAESVPVDCIAVNFDHADGRSRQLAELVVAALRGSLKDRVNEVILDEGPDYERPAVEVLPGAITYLDDGDSLKSDVFKQKIAGAVFDGLKAFFELDLQSSPILLD